MPLDLNSNTGDPEEELDSPPVAEANYTPPAQPEVINDVIEEEG